MPQGDRPEVGGAFDNPPVVGVDAPELERNPRVALLVQMGDPLRERLPAVDVLTAAVEMDVVVG
ncbi:hypothetical protein GCM10009657_10670 [Oryzihumus leptocrescens]